MDKNTEPAPWTQLREGNPNCPSDFALDRLQAGELPDGERQVLQSHVADCAVCPQRMTARSVGFAGFKELDERKLLASIRRQLADEPQPSTLDRLLRRLRGFTAPLAATALAAAAAAVVLWGRPGPMTQPDPDGTAGLGEGTREKGGLALSLYRLADGRAQQTLSGDHFVTGDRVRFVVDLPTAGQVAVLGLEPKGGLYVAWPSAGAESKRPAGPRQELPGAVALDASVGKETLYLVLCPGDAQLPAQSCKAGTGAAPSCPVGCQLTPFVMNKN